jgi:uncharacterized membrane protein HdeD (DUF308 family)
VTSSDADLTQLLPRWWMLVIRGVAAIGFGLVTLAVPNASLFALVMLWGAYALVNGVFSMTLAAARGRAGLRWGFWLFEGLVSVGAAVVTFVWPAMTASVLLGIMAVWAIFTGIAAIFVAIRLRREIRGEWLLATSGVLSIAFGALLLARPMAGALAVAGLIGAYALVFGTLLIALGIQLNRLRRRHDRSLPAGAAPAG